MGGFKHEQKSSSTPEVVRDATGSSPRNAHSFLHSFIWTLTLLTLCGTFGFMYYVQFHEIHKLKARVDTLELGVVFGEVNPGTDSNGIETNTDLKKLVQKLVDEQIKSNSQNLKDHIGEPCQTTSRDKRSHVTRQLGSSSCCTSLQKPGYLGNNNEVVTSYIGQNVMLPCNATGFPPPKITFTPAVDPRGANRYITTPNGLEITNTQVSDAGAYTCVIENVFGKESKTILLRVTDPVVVTTSPSNVIVKDGDTITIRCDATGTPNPVVTWSHTRPDGTVLQVVGSVGGRVSITSDNTLTITNAKASDAGSYTCKGVNIYETDSATSSVYLSGVPEIVNPPKTQTVFEGDKVTLYCTVISSPPAVITWTYPLTGTRPPLNAHLNPDNSITLSGVDKFNNGDYTCQATNSQGTVTASSKLIVEKGVTVTTAPHLQAMTGTEPVLNFQCTADGDPVPTITWSKVGSSSLYGNSKYLILPGGNLIVTSPSLNTDTGIYECRGQNRNGNRTDRVIVYRERGSINCTATFSEVGCGLDVTCGATCPTNCNVNSQGDRVYGNLNYAMDSSICLSAYHGGFLPTPGSSKVVFTNTPSKTFAGSLSNGIQSLSHAPGDSNEFIRVPPNAGSAGNSLIG